MVNPIEILKKDFPYPEVKPNINFNGHGFFESYHEKFFLHRIRSCKIILEIGTYYGKSLRFFLNNSRAKYKKSYSTYSVDSVEAIWFLTNRYQLAPVSEKSLTPA